MLLVGYSNNASVIEVDGGEGDAAVAVTESVLAAATSSQEGAIQWALGFAAVAKLSRGSSFRALIQIDTNSRFVSCSYIMPYLLVFPPSLQRTHHHLSTEHSSERPVILDRHLLAPSRPDLPCRN